MNSLKPSRLAAYGRAARRRKFLLIFPALILGLATSAALKEMPKLYRSSARLAMAVESNEASPPSARLDELRRRVTSRDSINAIANGRESGGGPGRASETTTRARIGIEPDAKIDSPPGAFLISFSDPTPEAARDVANELATRLVAQSQEEATSNPELDALRKRAKEVSARLLELEEKDPWLTGARADDVGPARQPTNASALSLEAQRMQQMTIESLKDQQYKFQQQLADLDRRVSAQRQQVVEQQRRGRPLNDNPTYSALVLRRTELQGQRDTLLNRQELTDKHPRVSALNDQIAAVNREIEELRKQDALLVSQTPEARELSALESDRNRVKIDLELAGRELSRRSASTITLAPAPKANATGARPGAASSRTAQDYFHLKRAYKEISGELQDLEARRKPAGGIQLRLIEPATLPDHPVESNRALLVAIAAIVGLALGAVLARLAERARLNSLQNARDVAHYTRLPMLAAISTTMTTDERRRAWWRPKAGLAVAAVVSLLATFALTKVLVALDIFALLG